MRHCYAGLFCSTATADSFRCNSRVILEGASTLEVISKCGQPTLEEKVGYVKINNEYVQVVKFLYDLGKGKLTKILEFRNGRLYKIEDGFRTET